MKRIVLALLLFAAAALPGCTVDLGCSDRVRPDHDRHHHEFRSEPSK